mgnify:CR=1 FL=1
MVKILPIIGSQWSSDHNGPHEVIDFGGARREGFPMEDLVLQTLPYRAPEARLPYRQGRVNLRRGCWVATKTMENDDKNDDFMKENWDWIMENGDVSMDNYDFIKENFDFNEENVDLIVQELQLIRKIVRKPWLTRKS